MVSPLSSWPWDNLGVYKASLKLLRLNFLICFRFLYDETPPHAHVFLCWLQYLLYGPLVAEVIINSKPWDQDGKISWCLHLLILCSLRGLIYQLWGSFGSMIFLVRRRRVLKEGVDFKQIDNEWDWYELFFLLLFLFFLVIMYELLLLCAGIIS